LIVSTRQSNGYREFDDATVDRVLQMRGLLAAGLPVASSSPPRPRRLG
jgi:DNA-binding transcriptional MerR regulator